MRYVKPHYYDAFKCIADKCPDTCCAGWQIVIDEESLEKYAGSKDEFSGRLKNSIDWKEGTFLQHDRRCAMLNENNLCDLVTAKGEGWLCKTCDRYPRHTEEFDGVREMSLSLSCPVVAEMILRDEEKVHFLIEEDQEPDPLEEEFEDFDFMLFTQLEDARNVMFSIVQNRELPVESRMAIIMEMATELQNCMDEGRLFDMQDVIGKYDTEASISEKIIELTKCDLLSGERRYEKIREHFKVFHELERLCEDWDGIIENAEESLYAQGHKKYSELAEAFYREYVQETGKKWEIFLEQILMFFLYTYFCGAVYDECIYSKVALSVFSVCYIQEFIMSEWHGDGKQMKKETCIRLAYRYAREVEHSDINLNLLEEWFMKNFDENKVR